SSEGISALARSLGRPLIMDNMTARMCQFREGRLDYARVLVEFDVMKGCKDKIEIQYRDKNNNVKGSKHMNVEYAWNPDRCTHCKVFGHCFEDCTKMEKNAEELERDEKKEEEKKKQNMKELRRRRSKGDVWKKKEGKEEGNNRHENKDQVNGKKTQNEDVVKTGNKYDALIILEDDNEELEILKERMIVDTFLVKEIQPNGIEIKTWSNDMVKYFKEQKELKRECRGLNVTLKNEEHSAGGSRSTGDMQEFVKCVNDIEVEHVN
ncbi:RNA-directed DNA polymerase, eukaryota, reverse transcriptase zinc-binding domain protein, partial [Tanacetum coccineum]